MEAIVKKKLMTKKEQKRLIKSVANSDAVKRKFALAKEFLQKHPIPEDFFPANRK